MGLELDRIYQGDCLKWLQKLDECSVDLAFADPPFNIGYEYDVYRDRRKSQEYLAWSREWIQGVQRVLKPKGTFWLAIGDDYAAELKVLCTRDLGLHCRNWVVWFYTFGVHCKQKFTRSHAHLFYFVKDPKNFVFNSLAVRVPSARELVYGDKRADPDGRVPDDTWMMAPTLPPDVPTRDGFVLRPQDIPDRFPAHSDTWYFSRVAGTFKERRGWHGCQMPEQLLGRIIKACSHEEDLVLDPFGGSGTTLAVAKKLKRRFMGFELSKEYAKKIEKRLARISRGDALVGPENAVLSAPRTNVGRQLRRRKPTVTENVSQSTLIAKANVSLGQFAAANGELATAVVEAFMAAHNGYSADRLLADPALNDRFLENCRFLGIPGEAKDWNHLLLNVRKRGALSAIDTSRRTNMRSAEADSFIFASEIAWRKISKEHDCTLDDILCDPTLVCQFDKIAKNIAPGFSSFQYRWGALAVRKWTSKGNALLDRVGVIRLRKRHHLPTGCGHYLITAAAKPFFVGYAKSLRSCPFFNPDRLGAALESMEQSARAHRDIEIRTRASDSIATTASKEPGKWQAARRAKLVGQLQPIANMPHSCQAA